MSPNSGRKNDTYILWGAPLSLYTGKARSYLIKKGVPYRERFPADAHFQTRILPRIGFFVVPVLEAPDGEIIQDTSDLIEHLEARFPEPALFPSTPVQRAVALLIDAFGSEALLRPAMHYRWSYLAEQESFLRAEFGRAGSASHDRTHRDAAAAPFMQAMQAHLPPLGVTPETIPAIERSYEALLDILDAHFLQHPYILGGRPSIADFGLMAPLFAHLARDPHPATLMKTRAPNVFRWTERMNLPGFFDGEFAEVEPDYPSGDAIQLTLEPLLALIFSDWGPELAAIADQYNGWIAQNPPVAPGAIVSVTGERTLHPNVGAIRFELRGTPVTCAGAVQALWHFGQAAAYARTLTGDARAQFDALVRRAGGEQVMGIALARPLERENCVLVVA
jgi:glutathione S-transferase